MKATRVLWAPVRWKRRSWKQRSECVKEVHLLQGLAESYQGELTVLIEHFPKYREVQFYLQVKWNFFQMDIILPILHMRETKAQRCCHLSTQHMEQNQDEETAPCSHFCYSLRRMKETHKAFRGIVHIHNPVLSGLSPGDALSHNTTNETLPHTKMLVCSYVIVAKCH